MRALFRWLTTLLFVAVVVQVGLAGYGAFHAIHAANRASISKKTIENAFNTHAVLGSLIVAVMVVLLVLAAAGRLEKRYLRTSAAIVVLGILQAILGGASTSTPALGFLHTVNALAIFAVSGSLAHHAWTDGGPGTVAPARSPALPRADGA